MILAVLLAMASASTLVVGVPVYRATSWWADRRHRLALARSRQRRP